MVPLVTYIFLLMISAQISSMMFSLLLLEDTVLFFIFSPFYSVDLLYLSLSIFIIENLECVLGVLMVLIRQCGILFLLQQEQFLHTVLSDLLLHHIQDRHILYWGQTLQALQYLPHIQGRKDIPSIH